ncbi:hypothetical protein [Escherichia coli]|nr:hypothetical protein [Escherichia coli]QZY67678.1 hypothetical protein K7X33_16420 [Escherichia coli]
MLQLVVPRWLYRILKAKSDAEGKSVASIIIDTLVTVYGQDATSKK